MHTRELQANNEQALGSSLEATGTLERISRITAPTYIRSPSLLRYHGRPYFFCLARLSQVILQVLMEEEFILSWENRFQPLSLLLIPTFLYISPHFSGQVENFSNINFDHSSTTILIKMHSIFLLYSSIL